MMEHFDDMMRRKLEEHESHVPKNLFDKISSQMAVEDEMFDTGIREKLSAYEADIPADMWNRIHKTSDRKKPVAWWIAAAVLAFLAAGVVYTNTNNNNKKQGADATHSLVVNKQPVSDNTITGVNDAVTDTNTLSDPGDAATQKTIAYESNTNPVSAPKNVYNNSEMTRNGNGIFRKNNSAEKVPFLKSSSSVYARPETDKTIIGETLAEPDEPDVFSAGNRSLLALASAAKGKLTPQQLFKTFGRGPIDCPDIFGNNTGGWYVDGYISPMMNFKQVSGKIPGKNVAEGMDSSLHRQVSFNTGFSLVKTFGNGLLMKTGLQYNQVNELFKITQVNEIKTITTISVRTVIIAPGDTVYIRDTTRVQQMGTITRQTQNRYKSWDIPVIFGYEFGGKGIRINANAGVIANIRTIYSGSLRDTAQRTHILFSDGDSAIYKTKIGLSLYAGFSLLKPVFTNTDFFVEPFARFNLKNTTTGTAWFNQKNIVAGISFGLRYKISKGRQH